MQQERPPQGTPVPHPSNTAVPASRSPRLPVQPRWRPILVISRSRLEQLLHHILNRGCVQRPRLLLRLEARHTRGLKGGGLREGPVPCHAEGHPKLGPSALLGLLGDVQCRRRNPFARRVSIIGGPVDVSFHIHHGDLGFQALDVVKQLDHIVVDALLQVGQLLFHFLDGTVRMLALLRQRHGNKVHCRELPKRRILPYCLEIPDAVQRSHVKSSRRRSLRIFASTEVEVIVHETHK
mmetsp:Transcript_70495/g.161742  ORF Transcript_70495/g.161742 Transcript_70495/m.161742 type:complete len:237 (-) Transcript_70495:366-1076(-)